MDILIIEDELLSADRLSKLLVEVVPEANVVSVLSSVEDSIEFLNSGRHIDLILSDINLPDGLCFSIFDECHISCPIIFITAYNQYAIKAFDYNSIAYLMKPIRKEELEKAVLKLLDHKIPYTSGLTDIIKAITKGTVKWRERILIQNVDEAYPINVKDVSFFIYDLGLTRVVMNDNSSCLCDISLDRLEEQLDPEVFLRVSRQHIVNISDVVSIKRIDTKHSNIRMKNSSEEIVSTNSRCNRLKILLNK